MHQLYWIFCRINTNTIFLQFDWLFKQLKVFKGPIHHPFFPLNKRKFFNYMCFVIPFLNVEQQNIKNNANHGQVSIFSALLSFWNYFSIIGCSIIQAVIYNFLSNSLAKILIIFFSFLFQIFEYFQLFGCSYFISQF